MAAAASASDLGIDLIRVARDHRALPLHVLPPGEALFRLMVGPFIAALYVGSRN